MKILLINNSYPSSKYPERSTYIQSVKECLQEAGNKVDVLALYPTGLSKRDQLKDYLRLYINIIFKRMKTYDCLYINHYPYLFPLFWKLPFYGKKVIFHWHGEELVNDSLFLKLSRRICRLTLKKGYVHISPSHYYKKIITEKLPVKESDIFVSPSGGVDTTVFCSKPKNENFFTAFHIGFPSALSEHKGVRFFYALIQNSEMLEEETGTKVFFHYIKYGKECSYWEKVFSVYTNVIGHDSYSKKEMPRFYQHIDLCLMLSKRESLGLVALEAMACNIPVIARNTTSMPEIVKSGVSGEIVSYNPSVDELREKIKCIYHRYNQYTPRAYIVENYSKKAVIDFYKQLITPDK